MSGGKPAYEQVRQQLREEIISGRLLPGSRLTTAEAAQRYGVSQMPVREALHRLEGEGLVEILPHRGARILSVDITFVRNLFDIRSVIEGLLTRLSAPNLSYAAMAKLRSMNEEMRRIAQENDLKGRMSVDREFHSTIYQYAENPEALKIYAAYSDFLLALRRHYGFGPDRPQAMLEQHANLLEALHAGEVDRAEALARNHSLGAKEDLLQRMREAAGSTVAGQEARPLPAAYSQAG